jgi:collagen type III alpha
MSKPVPGGRPPAHDRDPSQTGASASAELVAYDRYIDSQLQTARRQVRSVDIAVSLVTLGAGTLGFFLLVAVFDHWILPGGLGGVGRWLALGVYLAAALAFVWHSLLPLCIRRINPVYAAAAIERSKPTLKNSLINFLLLRARPEGLSPVVFEAIEQHAATELAQVPVDATIDRSQLIKAGYIFLGLLLAAAVYKVVSPKDPFQTFGRIMAPWADIAPPTRVSIVAVRPGNSTVMRGQAAKISAEVHGLPRDQAVTLVYSTDDGQIVDRAVPMRVPTDGYHFEADLPEGKGGIQQDVQYRVVAGDATSNEFHLTVQAAPTIVVESVDYEYPGYTGMVGQTVDHQGDLKAIEGTRVTLHAVANQPIKSAVVDFDCNGTDDLRMTLDDRHASATITLALKADRASPEYSTYQLRFTNLDGRENPQPIRHQIEVTRDLAPEIQFLAPKREEIDLPLNVPLACEISAHDPDFALVRVALVGQAGTAPMFERPLLEESKDGQPWQGQFHKKLTLTPKKLGLKVGDVLEYWAWAEDNKSPAANRTETARRRARIVAPTQTELSPDALAKGDQGPDGQPEGNAGDDKQPGDEPDSPDAEDKTDDHADLSPPGSDKKRPQDQQGDNEEKSDPDHDRQPGKEQTTDKKQDPGAGEKDRKQGQQDSGSQGQAGEEKAGQDQSGQEGSQGGQSGKGQSGKGKSGKEQSGKGQSGKGHAGKDAAETAGSEQGQSGDSSDGGQEGTDQGGNQGQSGKSRSGKQGSGKQGSGKAGSAKPDPVAQDGSEDGEAFERILDRQNEEQDGTGGAQTNSGQSGSRGKDKSPASQPPEKSGSRSTDKKAGKTGDEKSEGKETTGSDASDHGTTDKTNTGDKDAGGKRVEDKPGADDQTADGDKMPDGDKRPAPTAGDEKDSPDGSQDGTDGAGGKSTSGKSSDDKDPMDDGTGGGDEKTKSGDGKSTTDGGGQTKSGQQATGKQPGNKGAGDKGAGEKGAGEKEAGDKGAGDKRSADEHSGEKGPDEKKQGAGSGTQGKGDDKQPPESSGQGQPDGKAGSEKEEQGQPGAGQENGDDKQNSPSPQGENKPTGKNSPRNQTGDKRTSKSSEPPAASGSEKQSDSQGDESGDRSGGGKKGGGQKSQQAGAGNPGSQSEAEEGGDATEDPSGQESSDQPGEKKEGGEKKTDSEKSGDGKTSRTGPQKTGPGAKQGSPAPPPDPSSATEPSDGKGSDKPGTDLGPGHSPSGKPGKAGSSDPEGPGNVSEREAAEPPPPAPEVADAANLDFSRKATELSIQRLRDQLNKGQIDQELLDRLQWTQADMERWVSRWESMFRRSQQQTVQGQAARTELDATLRSLGLKPHGIEISGHRKDDLTHGMKEGIRTRPPAEYRDQVRQYTQGISRNQSGGNATSQPNKSANDQRDQER